MIINLVLILMYIQNPEKIKGHISNLYKQEDIATPALFVSFVLIANWKN